MSREPSTASTRPEYAAPMQHPGEPLRYDRDGTPLTLEQWAARAEDRAYKRVARTAVFAAHDPTEITHISTVWLGLDMAFTGPPLIFETMVFGPEGGETDGLTSRYPTLATAHAGHHDTVARIAARIPEAIVAELAEDT